MENQYYIEIDGEQIPVTEEVYRAYKRPLWAEHKRKERSKRCRNENGFRCTKDCKICPKTRDGSTLSLDKFSDDGFDVADQSDMAELVADKLLLEQLTYARQRLHRRGDAAMYGWTRQRLQFSVRRCRESVKSYGLH